MTKARINVRRAYREQLRLFINLSNTVRNLIRNLFKRYADLAEAEYLNSESIDDDFFDELNTDLYFILRNNVATVYDQVNSKFKRDRLRKQDDEFNELVMAFVSQFTAQNVTNISNTTKNKIKKEIELGLQAGLALSTIAENIKKSNAFSPVRATLIARTETHQAMNAANQDIAKTLGLNKPVKRWASALDDRTRSWHRSMDGVTIKENEDFSVLTPISGGGFVEKKMSYAGDAKGGASNVINCICFVLYFDEDDIVE